VLKRGSDTYQNWLYPPVPFFVEVYLFNITNPDEFSKGSEELVLNEIGPFVYQEYRLKFVKSIDNESVTYDPRYFYEFRPELSGGLTEDKNITTVNVPLIVSM